MTVDLTHIAVLIAILGVAVVYGTDVFCAVVMRLALASLDDDAVVAVMGRVHRYGDRRMPIPGALGLVAALASAVLAAVAGHWAQAISAGIAVLLLVIWLVLYTRVSAPINRTMTAATDTGRTLTDGRALQTSWDRIITTRAALQGVALAALCLVLAF